MRIKTLLKVLFLFLSIVFFSRQAKASHLFGGEFTYKYMGPSGSATEPFQYKFTYKTYVTCVGFNISPTIDLRVYQKNGTQIKGMNVPSTSSSGQLSLPVPQGCAVANLPCIRLKVYETTVNLPLSFDGYYVSGTTNARNNDITNISNVGGTDLFLYMDVPSPLNPSSSPVFSDTAVVVMFKGDTTTIINSAFDTDGDKLIYSFNNPYGMAGSGVFVPNSTTIPSRVGYKPGFSFPQPFGANGYASINASTGLAKYYVPNIGNYVVSFQVKEYRNINGIDILIGSTIRDIQLVVVDAPASTNLKPNFTFNGSKVITITEGQSIPPINFTFTDPNTGQLLQITASSPLLDGPGNKNASFNSSTSGPVNINNAPSGTTATFNYTSVCGESNYYPLDITVADNSCPPGKKVESFQIVVLPYDGPDKIFGDTTVCTGSSETYNVTAKTSATYKWRLPLGATIIGANNTASVQVQWALPGRHKLTVIETSTGNCQDSVSVFVNVAPGVNLSLNASASAVCVGTPVTLNVTGGSNYAWTDGTNNYTGSSITVTPTSTTTYSVTSSGSTSCNGANSITVTVNPLPNVNAGSNRNVCSGNSTTLTASGADTYTWTNGTNTFTGNNVVVTPSATTTYTVTGTNTLSGCSNTSQVTLTVVPAPTPSLVALANSYCKDAPAVTLDATQGSYTIDGIAATTLNPAALTVGTHNVIVTSTVNGCTGTATKTITINDLPAANINVVAAAYCKNAPAVSLNIAGSAYQVDGANATSFDPATLSVGIHTVSVVTTNAQGCSATATKTVTINALPTPSLAFLANAYCTNEASQNLPAGSGGTTITYTVNGTAATSFNPATLSPGNYTVAMNETNVNGCSASVTKTVAVNAIPVPAITNLSVSYCQNDPSVTIAANLPGSTFTIDGVAATVVNPAALSVGTHTVSVSNTNTNNCTGTATQNLTIKAVPVANFGTLANAYCKNDPAVSLVIAGSKFTINGTSATSFNPANLTVGNHIVSVTTKNSDSCAVVATKTVNILAVPAPVINLNNDYCKDAPAVTLDATQGSYTIDGIAATTLNPAALTVGTHNVIVTSTVNGCTGTATKTITINDLPAANINVVAAAYCKNAPAVSLNIAGSAYQVDGANATSFDPATLSVGIHTVSVVTTNAQGCSATATKTVTINALPTPSLAFLANAYCTNEASQNLPAGSGGTTITYTVNGTAATSFNPAALTPGNYTVVMNETNVNGCSASVTKTVAVNAIPVPAITNLSVSYCQNDPSVTIAANLPGSTFTIDGVAATVVNPAALSVGTHTVSVSNTNTNNCTGTATQNLTIKAVPVANFGTLANAYCKNDPAVSLVIAGSKFTINGTSASSFNPANLTVGNHIVSVTTKNSDSCAVVATKTVTINAVPAPTLTLNNAYCQNAPAVSFDLSTGNTYTINGTAATVLNPASLPLGSNAIVVSNTNATGCTGTATQTITINPVPLTDPITGPTSICPGITGIKYKIQNPRVTNYQWTISAGHGTIVSGQGTTEITVNWNGAASATISAAPVNTLNCTGVAATLAVTINPILITPQPVGPLSICKNQANNVVYVMPNPTKGSTFTWTITGGTVASSNAIGDTVRVNWSAPGTGTIVVQEASTGTVNCFGSSAPLSITILASPDATLPISGPASVCENTNNVLYTLSGTPNSTYAWSQTFNGNTTTSSTTTGTVPFNFGAPGQYTITVVETNASLCAGLPINKTITVTPRPVIDTIYGSEFICPDDLNNHWYSVKGPAGATYNWQVTGGTFASTTNDSILVSFDNNPVKTITVTPTSGTGCAGIAYTRSLTLDAAELDLLAVSTGEQNEKAVELTFDMPNNTANKQSIDIFRKEAGNGTFTKIGTVANGLNGYTDNNLQTDQKVYQYKLESRNECGSLLNTTFHNTILVKATGNEAAKSVELRWNTYRGWGNNGVLRYEIYDKADNGSYVFIRNVNATDTTFTLADIAKLGFNQCFRIKAISTDGQVSWSNSSCVVFENKLMIYNIITPNGDDKNEFFTVENIELYPGNELMIYNRWGTEVFNQKDYKNNWNGKGTADGTYYYLLKLPGGQTYKGWVEITR